MFKFFNKLVTKLNSNVFTGNCEFNIKPFIDNIIKHYENINSYEYIKIYIDEIDNSINSKKENINMISNLGYIGEYKSDSYIKPELNASKFNFEKQLLNILNGKFIMSNQCFFDKTLITIYQKALHDIYESKYNKKNKIIVQNTKYFEAFEISYDGIENYDFSDIILFCQYEMRRISSYLEVSDEIEDLYMKKEPYKTLLKLPILQCQKYITKQLDDLIGDLSNIDNHATNMITIDNEKRAVNCVQLWFKTNCENVEKFNILISNILNSMICLKNKIFSAYYNKISNIIDFYVKLPKYLTVSYDNVLNILRENPNIRLGGWEDNKDMRMDPSSSGRRVGDIRLECYLHGLCCYFCPLINTFYDKLNVLKNINIS